jgi:hypothetical protein
VGSTWLLWRPQLVACAGIGATNSTNLSAWNMWLLVKHLTCKRNSTWLLSWHPTVL